MASQTSQWSIPPSRFDNGAYLDRRVRSADPESQGSLRTALRYLYESRGPDNLPRDRLKRAQPYLENRELIVGRWLYTRTNGNLRKHYGKAALRAARRARYRCQECGYADVRALNLDHVGGRRASTHRFACLCANCHTIKSRHIDWTGT